MCWVGGNSFKCQCGSPVIIISECGRSVIIISECGRSVIIKVKCGRSVIINKKRGRLVICRKIFIHHSGLAKKSWGLEIITQLGLNSAFGKAVQCISQ